ncbi:MAG TPA: IS607 family element RNA-guided endonuclease TnpB [Pseudonocardiaceae bacterium]|jgi:putative transposase
MTTTIQAYRFALDPSPGQNGMLRSHCGAQRYAFNWGLGLVKANLGQRDAERSYGVPDIELTPPANWSAYSLRKTWNQAKDQIAPWWPANSKESYASGLANLATALGNWHSSKAGTRRGPTIRFPRFKGKHRALSCRFTTGNLGLANADRRHVRLPRIGVVRTLESTRKLARHVERGTARVRSATVSHRGGRWQVSFSVEITRTDPPPTRPPSVVGVDLGITSLAVLSTGEIVPNPKHLELAQRELRRLQRQATRRTGPDRRTRQQPSGRWRRTQARITRLHTAVAHARRDGLHQLTTRLASIHGTIVVEDLHVAGMLKNRCLARLIAGAGWGELRRQFDYKTRRHGGRLVVADRWYPSSKTCSNCHTVKTKLRLSERMFHCDQCGFTLDRDLNAARNLAGLVSSHSWWATVNEPDGNPRQTRVTRAVGTATGRPTRTPGGSTPRRKTTAQNTSRHVF